MKFLLVNLTIVSAALLVQSIIIPRTGRLINGSVAQMEQFPYVVYFHNDLEKLVCTGTLFTLGRVVTAGHCIDDFDLKYVYAGDINGNSKGVNDFRQRRGIKKTYIKNTARISYHVDVGVVDLDSPFKKTTFVRSLSPEEYPSHGMDLRHSVFAVGYGVQSDEPKVKPDGVLRWQHFAPTIRADECKLNYFSLCLIGEENSKMGRIDDGGPLLVIEHLPGDKIQLYFYGIYVFRRDDNGGYDVFMDAFKLLNFFQKPEKEISVRKMAELNKNRATRLLKVYLMTIPILWSFINIMVIP